MPDTPRSDTTPDDDAALIERLGSLLAALPAPLEPLTPGALDGYLCGVLLQPKPVPAAAWLPHVFDTDGRAPPRGTPAATLQAIEAIARQRHATLEQAIGRRDWFDPWILEDESAGHDDPEGTDVPVAEAVRPWLIGLATALELHPALLAALHAGRTALVEPLALIYLHFGADELDEIEPELQEAIDAIEPPADLAEAVQELVRAVMLMADETRPLARGGAERQPPPGAPKPRTPRGRAGPGPGPRSRSGRRARPGRAGRRPRCARPGAPDRSSRR